MLTTNEARKIRIRACMEKIGIDIDLCIFCLNFSINGDIL